MIRISEPLPLPRPSVRATVTLREAAACRRKMTPHIHLSANPGRPFGQRTDPKHVD